MIKERLEEAIERIKGNQIMLGRQSGKSQFYEDMNVVIQQAERVQELEEVNKTNYGIASDFKFENLVLEQQNKRYREALEFYANENNYEIWNSMAVRSTEINRDKGYKARKALEEFK